MRRFNLLFYKGDGLISRVIQKVTKSEYSHVALVLDDFHLLETDWKYPVSIRHIMYVKSDYDVYEFDFNITPEQEIVLLRFIYNELNRKYDWKFLITRWFNIMFKSKVKDDHLSYTCDDLIYEAFLQIGIRLVENKGKLTPQTLSNSKYITKL